MAELHARRGMLQPQAEDGSWPGAMVVSFGPKKLLSRVRRPAFLDEQALTGTVHGRRTADMRAARIGVKSLVRAVRQPLDSASA